MFSRNPSNVSRKQEKVLWEEVKSEAKIWQNIHKHPWAKMSSQWLYFPPPNVHQPVSNWMNCDPALWWNITRQWKRNGLQKHKATGVNLTCTVLREGSQAQITIFWIVPYIGSSRTGNTNLSWQKTDQWLSLTTEGWRGNILEGGKCFVLFCFAQ